MNDQATVDVILGNANQLLSRAKLTAACCVPVHKGWLNYAGRVRNSLEINHNNNQYFIG